MCFGSKIFVSKRTVKAIECVAFWGLSQKTSVLRMRQFWKISVVFVHRYSKTFKKQEASTLLLYSLFQVGLFSL